MNIKIHPSKLADALSCEKAGVRALMQPPGDGGRGREHIAAWIGRAVHARLADALEPAVPSLVAFDQTTPTMRVALVQVQRMVKAIADELASLGWTVLAHEVQLDPFNGWDWPMNVALVGTADLLLVDLTGRGVLLDVKTSKFFHKAWLQLGAYTLLYERSQIEIPGAPVDIKTVGVVHCPRPKGLLDEASAELDQQDAGEVRTEASIAVRRLVGNIKRPTAAPASPGLHCQYCTHPTCCVRNREYHPY